MARKPSPKRQKLLDAAEQCFAERGFRGTTIANIAERASVPLGNVYYYYKTKDAFAEAVVAARRARFEAESEKWREADARSALLAYVSWSLSGTAALSRHGCPVHALVYDLASEESTVLEEARALTQLERAFVEERLGAGEAAAESPDRIARIAEWLLASLAGAKAFALTTGDPRSVGRAKARIAAELTARLL